MLGGLLLQSQLCLRSSHSVLWQFCGSQNETVCFCGHARCFCGFHTVDIKPSHLRGTYCLHTFLWPNSQQAQSFAISRRTITYLTMFIGFSPRGVSHAAFPFWSGIIYELSAGGERAISPPSAPSVAVMSPGWQQHSSKEYIYCREKNVKMWREALKDTHLSKEESGCGCERGGGGEESLGRSEGWTKIEIHQGTNEWGLDARIVGNKEIYLWILKRRGGIAVEQ